MNDVSDWTEHKLSISPTLKQLILYLVNHIFLRKEERGEENIFCVILNSGGSLADTVYMSKQYDIQ